jgi:hypothetical protein
MRNIVLAVVFLGVAVAAFASEPQLIVAGVDNFQQWLNKINANATNAATRAELVSTNAVIQAAVALVASDLTDLQSITGTVAEVQSQVLAAPDAAITKLDTERRNQPLGYAGLNETGKLDAGLVETIIVVFAGGEAVDVQ